MKAFQNTPIHEELREELALLLDISINKLPGDVSPDIAGKFLSTAPRTLAIWRSTGRYNLPYLKMGRLVRYRIVELVKFKASRIFGCTGEKA
ncbi:MAG: hypothetical protein methR_P1637 [Methyloprofundus sp.]|nr:MAG: hypothetical protein methR_P1637 [Methyloprofundus sp.]